MRNIKVSEDDFDTLYNEQDASNVVSGLEFVTIHDTGDHDNHGGVEMLLIVRKVSSGVLYAGEFAVDPGEGEVYEKPEKFYPVEAQERTIVVTDYLPISQ